ncbi:MAG: TetR/AcrR family transcriptional regulator, partial [Proteobacteria bacterium]
MASSSSSSSDVDTRRETMSKRKSGSGVEPRKEPKQQRSRQTYQVILQGAAQILRRDGFQKFSTNKVAEESGVSIGSLYQYFPSKEAIVAALIDQLFEGEYARMKTGLENESPNTAARDVIRQMLSAYFNINFDDMAFRRALIELVSTVDKAQVAISFHRSMAEMMLKYIHTHFSPAVDQDQETVLFMLTYMLKASAISSIDGNLQNVDKEFLINESTDMW